jgi:diguanylate cyclase (GGDEF)-like protein/PAS domain S-box-containing protein
MGNVLETLTASASLDCAERVQALEHENATLREQLDTLQQEYTTLQQAFAALEDTEAVCSENLNQLTLIAEHSTDMISCHAPDGSYRYVSPACETLLGYAPHELIGRSCYDFFHPDDFAVIQASHDNILETPIISTTIYRIRHKDGHYIWFETTSKTLRNGENGAVTEIIAVSHDVSERKQIEHDLEQSLSLLQSTIDSTSDGIIVGTHDGDIVTFNHTFERLWNLPPAWHQLPSRSERIGLVFEQLENREQFSRFFMDLSSVPEAEGYDVFTLKDGRIFECYTTPYRFGERITGRVWSYRDVSERVRAERELRENRARLKAIFDNAAVGIALLDANGRFVQTNDAWARLLGYTPAEALQVSTMDITHPDDRQRSRRVFRDMVRGTRDSARLEQRLVCQDGAVFWGNMSLTAMRDDGGALEGVVCILVDISDQKQAQDLLQVQRDIAIRLGSTNTLHDSLNYLLAMSLLVEGLDCGGIYLFSEQTGAIDLAVHAGLSPSFVAGVSHFGPDTAHVRMVRQGVPLYHAEPDIAQSPLHEQGRKDGLRSVAIVPILDKGSLVAVLNLASSTRSEIPERARAMIEAIAAQIGAVIAQSKSKDALRESENKLQTLFHALDDFLLVFGVDGYIIHWNQVVEQQLGYATDDIRGMHILNVMALEPLEEAADVVVKMIAGELSVCTLPLRMVDGRLIPVQTRVTRGIWDNREVLFAIAHDITELQRTQEALEQANQQLTRSVDELAQRNHDLEVLNAMGDQIRACHSLDDASSVIAKYLPRLFSEQSGGLYLKDTAGQMRRVAVWGTEAPDDEELVVSFCEVLQRGGSIIAEDMCSITAVRPQQRFCPRCRILPYLCIPLVAQGETMGVLHLRRGPEATSSMRGFWERLTETTAEKLALELVNLQIRERLRHQATRDPLTGLFNRRYLDETLKRELQRATRQKHSVGVVMLDIDHFKDFNDTYGHDGGDTLLRAVGALLQSQVRLEDIACRYGGEEFTLVMPGASVEDTRNRAEQLRLAILELQVLHNEQPLRAVTASLGVAVFPDHGTDDDGVVKAADNALYRAKTGGRNCVMVADE